MNIVVLQTITPVDNNWLSILWGFIGKIPLTELLVGVVVPIVAAWISYALAERATRRKEYNRLFIQIELVKKELTENKNSLDDFISKYKEKTQLKKELEFPVTFCKKILIEVLDKLEKIKGEYFYFDNEMLFEKPNCLYILSQKIESINHEIEIEEFKYYDDDYLDAKQKSKVLKLKEEKEEYISEFKKNQNRDIYKEFLLLQSFIEGNSLENIFEKMDSSEENFEILKYIYKCIKGFNEKDDKNKSDVALLYKKLVLFKISSDVVHEEQFDQDTFDLYYKVFEKHENFENNLYDMYGKYYKLVAVEKFLENYELHASSQKWNDNSSELVLLSDSELYIEISILYEKIQKFEGHFQEEKSTDIDKTYQYSETIVTAIVDIIEKLKKHQLKIRKWCK